MPRGDDNSEYGRPTTTFLYGPDKTKKTWWALRAAEDGYNVVLIDGDNGASIKNQLSLEARKRIIVVDCVNTPDMQVFPRFMATFMKGQPFIWDEQDKRSYPPTWKLNPQHSHIAFYPALFTTNDVVIPDSWTRLASSLMLEWAQENNVDLTSVEKEGDQFSLMGYQSRFLDFVLTKMPTFGCHWIVIGHETVYEKFEGKGKDRKVVEQRTQPFSSTGPHAKKLGAHFSNCLRFSKLSDISFRIDAGGGPDVMGGSRQLAPQKYDWKAISPQSIFGAVGINPTGGICRGAIYLEKGETLADWNSRHVTNVENTTVQAAVLEKTEPVVVNAAESGVKVSLLAKLKKS